MGSSTREHHAVGHVREANGVVRTGSRTAKVNGKPTLHIHAGERDVVQRDRLCSLAGHQPLSRYGSIVQRQAVSCTAIKHQRNPLCIHGGHVQSRTCSSSHAHADVVHGDLRDRQFTLLSAKADSGLLNGDVGEGGVHPSVDSHGHVVGRHTVHSGRSRRQVEGFVIDSMERGAGHVGMAPVHAHTAVRIVDRDVRSVQLAFNGDPRRGVRNHAVAEVQRSRGCHGQSLPQPLAVRALGERRFGGKEGDAVGHQRAFNENAIRPGIDRDTGFDRQGGTFSNRHVTRERFVFAPHRAHGNGAVVGQHHG